MFQLRPIGKTLVTLLIVPFLSACGFIFVSGPPVGWQGSSDLETMAITQPCTNSKALVAIDGALAGLNAIVGLAYLGADEWEVPDKNAYAIGSFLWAGVLTGGAISGNGKVTECRAFNAALIQQRQGDAVGQATYNWLDDFSPVPDFGVASQDLPAIIPPARGYSPVFSGSISNSPEQ